MMEKDPKERFEILDAGRAIGDLSVEEEHEWESLAEEFGAVRDGVPLDAIVAALEEGLSPEYAMPEPLAQQVRRDAKDFERIPPALDSAPLERSPKVAPNNVLLDAAWGWAAAACLALVFGVS